MATFSQRLVVIAVSATLVACTSLQQLPEANASGASRAHRQAQSVAVGDTLTVNTKLAAPFELVVTAVSTESITGLQDGQARQVMLLDIESIEKVRFDILRTALIFVALGIIALAQYAKAVSKLANP